MYNDASLLVAERLEARSQGDVASDEMLRIHPVVFKAVSYNRDTKKRREFSLSASYGSSRRRNLVAKFGEPLSGIDLLEPGDESYGWLDADFAKEVVDAFAADAEAWLPTLRKLHDERGDFWPAGLTDLCVKHPGCLFDVAELLKDAGDFLMHQLTENSARLHLSHTPVGPAQDGTGVRMSIQIATPNKSFVDANGAPYTTFVDAEVRRVAPEGIIGLALPGDAKPIYYSHKTHGKKYLSYMADTTLSHHRAMHLMERFPNAGF